MARTVLLLLSLLLGVVVFLLSPLLSTLLLSSSHHYVRTTHPPSPHRPPTAREISRDQLEEFRDEGVTVLREVLSGDWIRLLQRAVRDVATNKTLHCNMAYFNGPPILHRPNTFKP